MALHSVSEALGAYKSTPKKGSRSNRDWPQNGQLPVSQLAIFKVTDKFYFLLKYSDSVHVLPVSIKIIE